MKMKSIFSRRLKKNQKAQGMVEFAIILPILLLLIFGIIEFGRLMFIYASVASASREAVRYGSAVDETGGLPRYADCTGIRTAANRIGIFAGVQDADILIKYDDGIVPTIASCAGITDFSDIALGDRIVVSVTANYAPIVLFANIPSFPISSTSARTIIKRVDISGTPPPPPPPLPVCDLEFGVFSTDGNAATWPIVNQGESDFIKNIQLTFDDSIINGNGNLTKIYFGENKIWDGSVGSGELITYGDFMANFFDLVLSAETSKELSFSFTSSVVKENQNKYDLIVNFEGCGELDD
jgi:hypothetical protein